MRGRVFVACLLVSLLAVGCSFGGEVSGVPAPLQKGEEPVAERSKGDGVVAASGSEDGKVEDASLGSVDEPAPAAPSKDSKLESGGRLRVVVREYSLAVTDGKVTATLEVPATVVEKQKISKDKTSIAVEYEYGAACLDGTRKRTFTVGALEARIENVRALKEHRKKRYEEAAKGFRRAVELDPGFWAARTNLACALARLQKNEEAVEALRPLLAKEPIRTYFKVATDEDLIPLLDHPEVVKLKSPSKGSAKLLSSGSMKPVVAYSAGKGLWAVVDTEHSWGSMAWESRLSVYDAKSNELIFDPVLVGWGDTNPDDEGGGILPGRKKKVEARLHRVSRFLADMGFDAPKSYLEAKQASGDGDSVYPTKMKFLEKKLALIMRNGARLIRGDEVLAEVKTAAGDMLDAAYLFESPPTLIYQWSIDEPEGCDIESKVSGSNIMSLPEGALR